jgi:hypothetical protein
MITGHERPVLLNVVLFVSRALGMAEDVGPPHSYYPFIIPQPVGCAGEQPFPL